MQATKKVKVNGSSPAAGNGRRLIDAGGYIRMSTDKQAASPARQKGEIEQLAKRDGYRVVEWYQDEGMTGTESAKRSDFQRMLVDAKAGRFKAVLTYEQSRMSREDVFATMEHWKKLRDAGVCIVTCQRGKIDLDSLGGLITAIVDQYSSNDEVVKLAKRVASGQKARLHAGKRIGGRPFGYDREILDESGKVVRRVSFRDSFAKPPNWTSRLVVSQERPAVEAIKLIFRQLAEGRSLGRIARELNSAGVKPKRGRSFNSAMVRIIAENPIYVGTLRGGYRSTGKFARVSQDGEIRFENASPPIVDRPTFERAQLAIKLLTRNKERSPDGRYLLQGILRCGHCGHPLWARMGRAPLKSGDWFESLSYRCHASERELRDCNERPQIAAEWIEQAIKERLKLLVVRRREKIASASAALSRQSMAALPQETELHELRRRLSKASENLALASDESEFRRISCAIKEWESRERQVQKEIADAQQLDKALSLFGTSPESVDLDSEHLGDADRCKLALALRATIQEVRLFAEPIGNRSRRRLLWAELTFRPSVFLGAPLQFPIGLGGKSMRWFEFLRFVAGRGRPVTVDEAAEHFGVGWSAAWRQIGQLAADGLLEICGDFPSKTVPTRAGLSLSKRFAD